MMKRQRESPGMSYQKHGDALFATHPKMPLKRLSKNERRENERRVQSWR